MTAGAQTEALFQVRGLTKRFPVERGLFHRAASFVHAVDGISLDIRRGGSLGLVGESGCGKTTAGKMLIHLLTPTSGSITFREDGAGPVDVTQLRSGAGLKSFRRKAQMIFQDPYESLDPRMTVQDCVAEPLEVQGIGDAVERRLRVSEWLHRTGLTPPSSFLFRHPHELSGGQRQRAAIARALILEPRFVAADEPTSMLDVSIRAGIMQLMQDLAGRLGVSYLYITHDLAVARYMSQNLSVMYLGKIVETGETEEVLAHPLHPYTRALISAVPVPDPHARREPPQILGALSAPIDPPPRCRFLERCPIAAEVCRAQDHPPLEEKGNGHSAACYLA
jgi:peptide/nickel transport system ATP-binding protein